MESLDKLFKYIITEDIRINFGEKDLLTIFRNKKFKLLFYFRLANFFYKKNQIKKTLLNRLLQSIVTRLFNKYLEKFCCDFKIKTQIGKGLHIPHPIGIVINGKTKIGDYCTIMQQVTIGNKFNDDNVPEIGNNVFIGAGAKIIGNIKIEDNVIIGANAVVTKNISKNCIVAGVPAKIIGKKSEACNRTTHMAR